MFVCNKFFIPTSLIYLAEGLLEDVAERCATSKSDFKLFHSAHEKEQKRQSKKYFEYVWSGTKNSKN